MRATIVVLAAVVPRTALACPVCFGGSSERVLGAYVLSATFMSLLPLALVGGLVLWLRRRARDADAPAAAGHSSQA